MKWQDIPGWFSEADATVWDEISKTIGAKKAVIVEIGCWQGRSTCAMLDRIKKAIVYCVDTFEGTPGEDVYEATLRDGRTARQAFISNTQAHGGVNIIQRESLNAAEKFSDGELDVVFIDAEHSLDAVKRDINAWLPKIRPGGIIAGHDYSHPGVRRAVDHYIGREVKQFGDCWLYRVGETPTQRKLKVMIPVLDNGLGLVIADYMVELYRALHVWTQLEQEEGRRIEIEVRRASASHPNRGMNTITSDFLESDSDELLVIDTDTIINGQQLKWLFEHDLDLVYGMYPKKQVDEEVVLNRLLGQEQAIGPKPDPNNLMEVRRAGRGFMRIRRALFERLLEKKEQLGIKSFDNLKKRPEWDFWQSGVVEGSRSCKGKPEWITEDWMFDEFAREIGQPVYVDLRIYGMHEGAAIFPLIFSDEALKKVIIKFPFEKVEKLNQEAQEWRGVKTPNP